MNTYILTEQVGVSLDLYAILSSVSLSEHAAVYMKLYRSTSRLNWTEAKFKST